MVGIYFSGTGNTKFCVERFLTYYESSVKAFLIEDEQAAEAIKRSSEMHWLRNIRFRLPYG